MEPLTSVGISEITKQPALSFLLEERGICIESLWFFKNYFYKGKKNTHRADFFIIIINIIIVWSSL